jgi:hypothetical protein
MKLTDIIRLIATVALTVIETIKSKKTNSN